MARDLQAISHEPVLPPPLDTQVFGQTRWLARSDVVLRVVTTDRRAGRPVSAEVRVALVRKTEDRQGKAGTSGPERVVFQGRTDARGTADVQFRAPSPPGRYRLSIAVRTPIGDDLIERDVAVEEAGQVLLTTDKPIYQPGQTVHIRALALLQPDGRAAADRPLTFEVRDPRGNLVFRSRERTSRFGVAAAQFPIADEVTLGEYRVTARLGTDEPSPGSEAALLAEAERTVRVERYVLPKFKVTVETDRRFYLPAETLRGTVTAAYFFGKPVSRGRVTVRLSTFAAGWHDIAELAGTLDEAGRWQFETPLPERWVGLPLEGGNALLRVEATVTDAADHAERVSTTLPVSPEAIRIAVVPESPTLKPNLPMGLFVVTTYPDGTPAPCRFEVIGQGTDGTTTFTARGETDALGIGETTVRLGAARGERRTAGGEWFIPEGLEWTPRDSEEASLPVTVRVIAMDEQGRRAERTVRLWQSAGEEAVLLRTDRATARVGDVLRLDVLATPARSTVAFVDAIVHQQTVLTKTVDLPDGRGRLTLPLTPELAGTLVLHAYRITAGGDVVRDTRAVFVEPANELRVDVTTDKTTYRPGEPARVRLAVADPTGKPTVAALGLTVVDESVFALAGLQPGLERLYFALEAELLKPRYEVHGWELPSLLLPPEPEEFGPSRNLGPGPRDRIVRVLLTAAAPVPEYTLRVSTYEEKKRQVEARWRQVMEAAAEKIRKALDVYRRAKGRYPSAGAALRELAAAGLLTGADIRDPLGRPYRIRAIYKDISYGFILISAGFDGQFETSDDLWVYGHGGRERVFFARPMTAEALPAPPAPSAPAGEVRIRQFFPETLFVQPQLITDERGHAQVDVPLADSITTWRLTALANSAVGQIGSTTAPIRVFQDFFVDIDLPVAFTQGDEVAMPVALYNYLDRSQRVRLRLNPGEGFDLQGVAEKVVTLQPHEVTAVRFRLRAARPGTHAVTVHADGEAMSDAVRRTVTVRPDGKEVWQTISDALTGPADRTLKVHFPADSIEGARTLLVRVYPSAFTQVLDGLEGLLRLPSGCFEQTSSVTYPNVLVLSYLRRMGKTRPETEMKARHFITVGYQRLLTFEVPGGGFSWFGDPPAHQVLTAYGLLEFADMRRVHDVDPNLLDRTVRWLVSKQKPDGSWEPDRSGIQEGAWRRQTDLLRTTAYVSWAIGEVGVRDVEPARAALERAVRYLGEHADEADDGYALAVTLNALLGARDAGLSVDPRLVDRVAHRLAGLAREASDVAFWESQSETFFCLRGPSRDLETTALAAYALLRHGGHLPLAHKALTYLVRNKDAFGTWQTTQATIWALKAFLAAMEQGAGAADGTLVVWVGGEQAAEWRITPDTADVVRTVDASRSVRPGDNDVVVSFRGRGRLLYQVSSRFYLPWDRVPPPPEEPLQVRVSYDRSELQIRETVTCQVRVTNRRPATAQMVIVDVGVPPGFEVLTDDLTALVERKHIQRFELTPRQVIFYLDRIEDGRTVEWRFRLRAKLPVRAKTGPAVVYEYYAPQERGMAAPARLAVKER